MATTAPKLFGLTRAGWLAILLAAILVANGSWWGWTEIWNADQMVFKNQFRNDAWPFSPAGFSKPPLLTYIGFVTAQVPREIIVFGAEALTGNDYGDRLDFIGVWIAKVVHLLFACGSVYLLTLIIQATGTRYASVLAAFLFATSAGLIVQAHFLTTDVPVIFFMLLAFWSAQRVFISGSTIAYVVAGLLIGLTGAMKYNGVVVAMALPVFHIARVIQLHGFSLKRMVLDARVAWAAVAVPTGFFLGNPYAFIEYQRFLADLKYLFTTSPEFIGASGDMTREPAVVAILANDLIGWPLTIFIVVVLAVTIWVLMTRWQHTRGVTSLAALTVVALYLVYFASRTNIQVRWILVVVPFALIAIAPGVDYLAGRHRRAITTVGAALVLYGAVCSSIVGLRFNADPRNDAIDWIAEYVRQDQLVESSPYVPRWEKQWGVDIAYERMPAISGRARIYADVFKDNSDVLERTESIEREDIGWYTADALAERAPDHIVMSSLYFQRFLEGRVSRYYPELEGYFNNLLNGEYKYEITFDQYCCEPINFVYPKSLLFVDHRVVILQKIAPE